jgi:high-affinity K+ transport system ATPase subunit B
MAKANEANDSGIEFFGEVDLNKKGELASFMPAWSYRQLIEDMKEQIDSKKRAIDSGMLDAEVKVRTVQEHKQLKDRYESIISSKPKIDPDRLTKVAASLGEKISEAMFTNDQMKKGLADAHEEARRMSQPCIRLTDDEAVMAQAARIKGVKSGQSYMVSRTQAEKLWKLSRKALGELANTNELRK